MGDELVLQPPPAPPDLGLPKLAAPGEITADHCRTMFAWLHSRGVLLYGHQRAHVWASNLREFTIEDLKWLTQRAREAGALPHLEACLVKLHQMKAPESSSRCPTRPASTVTTDPSLSGDGSAS